MLYLGLELFLLLFLCGITFLFWAMLSYVHLVQSPACPHPLWCQRACGSVGGARCSPAELGAVHMASSRVRPTSASREVGTEEPCNLDSCLVQDMWVSLSPPVAGVFRGVSMILALLPMLCLVLGTAQPLSFLGAGTARRDSVSLGSGGQGWAGRDRKGAEGKLQQLVGNGILGCCKVALLHPVCRGGVLGCSGASLLCLPWRWCFRMLQGGSVPSQVQSWHFWALQSSPCSTLPSPVSGIMLGQGRLAAPSIPSAFPHAGHMITDSPMALLPPTCDLRAAARDVGLSLSQTRQESGVLSLRSCLHAGCGGNGVASLAVSALHLGMEQWLYLGAGAEESLQE